MIISQNRKKCKKTNSVRIKVSNEHESTLYIILKLITNCITIIFVIQELIMYEQRENYEQNCSETDESQVNIHNHDDVEDSCYDKLVVMIDGKKKVLNADQSVLYDLYERNVEKMEQTTIQEKEVRNVVRTYVWKDVKFLKGEGNKIRGIPEFGTSHDRPDLTQNIDYPFKIIYHCERKDKSLM